MKDPTDIEEIDIVNPPCTVDTRLVNYKGIYNKLAQGEINDPCG
jgi:hypothetical protein